MPDLPDDLARVFVRGGHPGGSASSLRILRAFRPEFGPADIVMSSKGHDAAAFLADAVERLEIGRGWLDAYRAVNGYPGHPERGVTLGAVVSTGSLGIGLSKAVGLAYARRSSGRRVFCIVGDGETQEGQVWEALQFAARYDLRNLIVFLDHNGAQSDNRPLPRPNILQPEAIFKAAGWAVYIADLDHPGFPQTEGPLCVLVHGEKTLPHALSQPGPLVLAYGKALSASLSDDPALIALESDLALDHGLAGLADAFPGRVLACGISEQHMVSCAVGLAAAGWHPICHTFERFYLRAAEQVLDALQEPGLVIRFVGGLAGLLPQGPGRSHELPELQRQALFPIQTYAPLQPDEVAPCVNSMLRQPRSTYLRLLAQPELGG
jgi:transketolase N-terminal domain/subunit